MSSVSLRLFSVITPVSLTEAVCQRARTFAQAVNGIPLGVKTQTQEAAERFGLSWTFQWGQQRRDPVLLDPDAWVCFVLFAETLSHCWVYPACQIQELTLAEPRLARLKGEKKVVYAQDLPPHLRLRLPKQPSLLAE